MLTTTQKQQIIAKVDECIATCENHYGRKFRKPTINFNLRGTTAGKAWPGQWRLDFHPVLANENWDDYIDDTVPHEVAHLIDYEMFQKPATSDGFDGQMGGVKAFRFSGRRTSRQKRSIHGPTWKSVMRVLGVEPSRCHSYDTSSVARRKTRYKYTCTCGHVYDLGPKYHKNIQTNARQYSCRKCRARLTPAMHNSPKVVETKKPAPVIKKGTKIEEAVNIVSQYRNHDRARVILMLEQALNMSKAGATTYYYKAKQMIAR